MTHATGNPIPPVRIGADIGHLAEGDRLALPPLVRAVRRIDSVWRRQMARQDYTAELAAVAMELDAAADLVTPGAFRLFLRGRALAFRLKDFRSSDSQWVMYLPDVFELIIGPLEPSEKLGGKKEFEGTLGIVLPDYQEKVRQYEQLAVAFEEELGRRYGFTPRYTSTPITVIDEIIAAGGATAFIAMASKLPNDEDIRASVGSKTTLFRNIIEAKFQHLTLPIARRVLGEEIDAEAFVQLIIGHELAHGFAFRFQREHFGSLASPLEEVKAEVFGILLLYFLAERGVITRETAEKAAIACIADSIREIRLDPKEAHAIGAFVRLNWFRHVALDFQNTKIVIDRESLLIVFSVLGDQLYDLAHECNIDAAKIFIEKWGGVPDSLRSIVRSLEYLPVDIDPIYDV